MTGLIYRVKQNDRLILYARQWKEPGMSKFFIVSRCDNNLYKKDEYAGEYKNKKQAIRTFDLLAINA